MSLDTKARSASSVNVACKLPHGLILRTFKEVKFRTPVLGGGMREETRFDPTGEQYTVHGIAAPQGQTPRSGPLVMGYAVTKNVPKELFDKWLEQNEDSDAVAQKMIFAMPDATDVEAKAAENEGRRSGLEPMNPSGDIRNPRAPNASVPLKVEQGVRA